VFALTDRVKKSFDVLFNSALELVIRICWIYWKRLDSNWSIAITKVTPRLFITAKQAKWFEAVVMQSLSCLRDYQSFRIFTQVCFVFLFLVPPWSSLRTQTYFRLSLVSGGERQGRGNGPCLYVSHLKYIYFLSGVLLNSWFSADVISICKLGFRHVRAHARCEIVSNCKQICALTIKVFK